VGESCMDNYTRPNHQPMMAPGPSLILQRHKHDNSRLPEDPTFYSHRPRLPIRDLRFEYSYIHSIQPCVEFRRGSQKGSTISREGLGDDEDEEVNQKERELQRTSGGEVVHIKWGKVAWITIRDQIISPVLQGAFWAIASYFLTPISAQVGQCVSLFAHSRLPTKEGRGVGWLRNWVNALGFGMNPSPRRS